MIKNCCSSLSPLPASLRIKVVSFKASCLFFKKLNQEFTLSQITPHGICPDLFYHLYPQYLSLLYNGKVNQPLVVECPVHHTQWIVNTKKFIISPIINIISQLLKLTGIHKDFIDKTITIETLKTSLGCPNSHPIRTKFTFNQYSCLLGREFFCPAVFYTLYPILASISKNPDIVKKSPIKFQCPADNTSITFEISA